VKAEKQRMILVSNRLPVTIVQEGNAVRIEPSSGGLVTALRPLLLDSAGVWVGWTGTDESPEIEQLLNEHS
jgi:trehalose-6-phosphate synthase